MVPVRNLARFTGKFLRQPFYALKVLKKRAAAQTRYAFGRGKAPMPEAVTLFLTHRCNLRCKMCGQWGESGVTKSFDKDEVIKELPLSLLCRLVDELSKSGAGITLFGGEPLLYGHCLDLVRYIKEKGLHCLMITNGALLERYGPGLVEAGIDEINLSLDGAKELHDEIRGLPGLFEAITSGIKLVNDEKKRLKRKKPLVNLQCTITKFNYERLDELTEVAASFGVNSLTYHNLIFIGKDALDRQKAADKSLCCSSAEWGGFAFEPDIDPERLFEKISKIKSKHYPFSVDFYPNLSKKGLIEYYTTPSYFPSEYAGRCLSPWLAAYVFPDGEVRPCLNSTYSFGNIAKDDFSKVWNSPQAVNFRQALKRSGIFPACARCTELYRY